jgi:CheY-like chemotaxis protein/plasmid maintenance system antidote protein VapI
MIVLDQKNIDIIYRRLGAVLREKRLKRGFTLAYVAKHLGISHQQVQKYEQATSKISAATLYVLANIYGVDIGKLFENIKLNEKINADETKIIDTEYTKDMVMNILLVEDNPGDEAITRKSLEGLKVNILCVHDGKQALDVLKYKTLCQDFPKPDLILLDVSLSKRDGISILKELKIDRLMQDIPVVMLTNNINADIMIRAYRNGAAGYICKSFDYESYRHSIVECVQYWSKTVVLPTRY